MIARSGGIKERSGHTEGSIDLMKLAGLAPCAVLCELTNDDGTMARLPEIIEFGLEHKYPVVTINDLKEYLAEQQIGFREIYDGEQMTVQFTKR